MAKQLNVNLAFTADTSQAKAQLQDLQRSLSQLIMNSTKSNSNAFGLTAEINEAIAKVTELQSILDSAQTKAGTLDLGKLNQSLLNSKTSLKEYASAFSSLGVEGEKAFSKLARSITTAEIPLKRTNTILSNFATTLKNTARWQISSSILHGFMSTLQGAYNYAKDLNESLNNIRIVSQQTTEQMAEFASEANKAAKSLSSTTTAYTNAALIYYQQGLSKEEVKERTDITIKMANVTRDSVEEVSNQLTAVWNNFDDGTKSLEHYADVMTALGAATASSTDEIAGGLEKFASIADMIGLSFEYAASALATITATTRQSEEVVGTALKTIFARIQGLNLGETLDDGTTLNKYSEALSKVGISIFDQAGELKDMDNILDEMGEKWETLTKDQQVALAQTVAGVRQYNQLVSLMDNWDYFQENLQVANTSQGSLQKQADIYAESWEAASKRARAAAESIYETILNDKFFISMTNGFSKFLEILDNTIDTLGGFPGVLSLISGLMFKIFGKDMVASIERWSYNLQLGSKKGLENILKQRMEINNSLKSMFVDNAYMGMTGAVKGDIYTQQANLQDTLIVKQQQLLRSGSQLTEEENKQAQLLLNINEQLGQSAIKATENLEKQQQTSSELERQSKIYLATQGKQNFKVNLSNTNELVDFNNAIKQAKQLSNEYGQLIVLEKQLSKANNFNDTVKQLELMSKAAKESGTSIAGLDTILDKISKGKIKDIDSLKNALNSLTMETGIKVQTLFNDIALSAEIAGVNMKEFTPILNQMKQSFIETGTLTTQQIQILKDYGINIDFITQKLKTMQGTIPTTAQGFVAFGQTLSSVAMLITTIKGLFNTWNNEDLSIGDKLLSTLTSLGIIIPMLTMALNKNSVAQIATLSKVILLKAGFKAEAQTAIIAGTSTENFGKKLLLALGPIGLVTAAIITLTLVVAELIKFFEKNSPEGQLKALEERADKSSEAFNRVSEAIDNTKTAIEELESSYDVIEKLTKGTDEWYKTIANTNAEVLKLSENYPELMNNNMIYSENGILKITQEGLDLISEIDRNRIQAANNLMLNDQIAVEEKEIENSYSTYGVYPDIAKGIQSLYEMKTIGENIFTKSGAKAIYDGIIYPEIKEQYTEEEFYNLLQQNKDTIRLNAEKRNNINRSKEDQFSSLIQSYGLNRSSDEVRELLGGQDYYDIVAKRRENMSKEFNVDNDWNDSMNYNEDYAEWDKIQDFMSLQGNDVKYVAQRMGNMVLEVDGEEIEYSQDEVYDALAELYSGSEFKKQLTDALSTNLSGILGDSVKDLNFDNLVNLDNFRQSIQNALTTINEEDSTDSVFKTITDIYGINEEGLESFSEDTKFIDLSDIENLKEFNSEIQNLQAGKITIDDFTNSLKEMNAAGQLDNMTSFFTSAAEEMGLDEENAKSMQDYAKYLNEIADESEILDDNLDTNADNAAKLSVQITKMNKGIEDLAEGFEDWSDILKNSSEESYEYFDAINNIKNAMSNILDINSDFLSSDFITNNMDDISQAANGSAEAIDRLRQAALKDIIMNLSLSGDLTNEEIWIKVQSLQDELNNLFPEGIQIGATLDTSQLESGEAEFIQHLNELIVSSGMTAEQVNAMLSGMGFNANFAKEPQEVWRKEPDEITTEVRKISKGSETGNNGETIENYDIVTTQRVTKQGEMVKGEVDAYSMETSEPGTTVVPKIQSISKKATGSMNNYSSSNKGGGSLSSGKNSGGSSKKSSPAKKQNYTKKNDVVERYYEITDALEDIADALEDATKASDRLYGKDKISAMEKETKIMQQQVNLLEEKRQQILEYLKLDKQALEQNKYGIEFTFDEDGDITNYTQIMTGLYNELYKAEEKLNTFTTSDEQSEYQESVVNPIKDKINEVKALVEQYDDSNDLLREIDNEIEDKMNEIQDKNYEKLSYTVEIKIEVNDYALEELEFYLDSMSDDFYKMAESAALMKNQSPLFLGNLESYANGYYELVEAYEKGEISQADYVEGMKDMRSGILESLSSLIELDKEMIHYYEDTLDAAADELSSFTDQLEHSTSILEHFQNMLGLIGRGNDFESIGKILEGQLSTTKNTLEAQKANYEMLLKQKNDLEQKLNAAPLGSKERELIEQEYKAITKAVIETEEEIYSTTESIGEIAGTILENNLSKAQKALESLLTGGNSIDEMLEKMDRLSKSQEEYLTKTNQLYETSKLIRQAQQDISDTDSLVAKKKYQDYINEIEALSEQNELSEYELEIAQAKYELLQAEIALEEAQNAKDSMRLVRDSNGNWNYVYTANQEKIDQAQQALEDAQNKLYNIGLEGAQDYQTKYAETMQEAIETFQKINQNYKDGMYASEEEYNAAMLEAQEYYYDLLKTYSDLYYTAHDLMVEESFQNEEDYIFAGIGDLEDFKDFTSKYLEECNSAFDNWKDNTHDVVDIIGKDFGDLNDKVNDTVDNSDKLSDKITSDLIPSLEDELNAVLNVTDAWGKQREELWKMIDAYKELMSIISSGIYKEAGYNPTIGYDSNFDYSAAMGTVEYNSEQYKQWLLERQNKIDAGYDFGNATNDRIDAFYKKGLKLGVDTSYKDFYSIPESEWKKLVGFNTGGYTGSWGPEGKLSILHEKELVLDQNDTSNLLSTIQLIKQMSLDINDSLISDTFNLINSLSSYLKEINLGKINDNTINQIVQIEASFPGVQTAIEIEQAFNNIINDASQYVSLKNN